MTTSNICRMNFEHLSSVVDIHLASFKGFFLSSMGTRFLKEFYRSVLLDETHIAYVCSDRARILGFVVGTAQPVGFYRRALKRNWQRFVLASILPVLNNPIMALRLLRRLVMAKSTVFSRYQAFLMSIAVNPNKQSNGLGKQLITCFLQEAKSRGASSVLLSTDAINNDSVNCFYLRAGFHLSRVYSTPEKRWMNEYIYPLDELKE